MQKPVLEYVRYDKKNPLLESVLIMSYKGISYDNTPYVCCGTTYSLGDVKVYHDCQVQYEDGVTKKYGKFFVINESCPRCTERSRMKKVRKVRAMIGYTLWKYGQRIVAIAHDCCRRKFKVGQEVTLNGRIYAPRGTKGYIMEIYEPYKGRTQDVLSVWLENKLIGHCKYKDLEGEHQRQDKEVISASI